MLGKARRRKNNFFIAVLGCVVLAAAACSSGPSSSPGSDNNQPTTPNASQSGTANVNSEWENIVNEAKKEGKVVISGSPSPLWKKSLVDAFEAEYPEIKVEYTGANGRDFWPRIKKEQELGQYLWDLRAGGASGDTFDAKNSGLFDPIKPLINAEHAKDDVWFGGYSNAFVDEEKEYMFSYFTFEEPTTFVNRDVIPESELSSTKQLLDPKYKGKISIQDLRGGASQASMGALFEMYGESFVADLLKNQELAFTADKRQQAEWLVRGRYPITIGISATELVPFMNQGLGKNVVPLKDERAPQGMGLGGIQVLKNAPHPNATKVYVNWLLSQKAQQQLVDNVQMNSRRLDVKPGNEATKVDPQKKDEYLPTYVEHTAKIHIHILKMADELLKK